MIRDAILVASEFQDLLYDNQSERVNERKGYANERKGRANE